MDLPKPPEDLELKNIIDKLANFVARNGPEFEFMTKNKQKDNPKFSFLFGGEYFNYYQYKVTTEQTIINHQKQKLAEQQQKLAQQQVIVQQVITQQAIQTAPWQQNQQATQQIQQLQQQIQQQQQRMQEQIKQSEQNLAAQYQSLIQQQQIQIEDAILKARDERLQALSENSGISIDDLNKVVQPIIESCTKDAISNGKTWIFTRSVGDAQCEFVTLYLLKRITAREASFQMRLHLIYLINDLLHHCQRKNADDLKIALEKIVVPAFCTASTGVEEEKKQKLTKLLSLWEQNKYFSQATIEQMKDCAPVLASYQASLITDHAHIVTQITGSVQQQYSQLQKQHQEYAAHLNTQLQGQQQQLQQLLQQQQSAAPPTTPQGTSLPIAQPVVVNPVLGQSAPTLPGAPAVVQPVSQAGVISSSLPGAPGAVQAVSQAGVIGAAIPVQTNIPTVAPVGTSLVSTLVTPQTIPQSVIAGQPDTQITALTSQPVFTPGISAPGPTTSATATSVSLESSTPSLPTLATATLGPAINTNIPPPASGPTMAPASGPTMAPASGPAMAPAFPNQPPPGHPAGGPLPQFPPSFGTPPPGFPPSFNRPPPYDYNMGPRGPAAALPPHPPDFSTPPPGMQLPDLSKPPPGFPLATPRLPLPPEVDLTPSVPYYELPAGLMAPLVKLEDTEYRPLDPRDIRLPPPAPPSERLLAAVEAFYSLPTHERPRDSEGWEKLGLYEFFKAKQKAKKIKEREREMMPNRRSPSRSPIPDFRRSRSRSPVRRRRRYNSGRRSNSRSRSCSRSHSRSSSPLPYQRSSRSPSPTRASHSQRKSRSRSATPPRASFAEPLMNTGPVSKLGEDNKGHQLLMKMGWGGRGLGATEQGIVEPISGGEVRDRQDKFKGVGIDIKDPFEQFRKNKSAGFIQRMRARDENIKETKKKPDDKNGD
ncbi:calcium homeostasis endoplasmic reticulum protein-like [Liolophura sinensis]|uniref:calcium homeostasis endoplasmic reticulum protein-like n=1 Tax=Liolophura sinensis TaxID=3198878 RepID=UPI0031583628